MVTDAERYRIVEKSLREQGRIKEAETAKRKAEEAETTSKEDTKRTKRKYEEVAKSLEEQGRTEEAKTARKKISEIEKVGYSPTDEMQKAEKVQQEASKIEKETVKTIESVSKAESGTRFIVDGKELSKEETLKELEDTRESAAQARILSSSAYGQLSKARDVKVSPLTELGEKVFFPGNDVFSTPPITPKQKVLKSEPKTEFIVGEEGQEQSISRERLLETIERSESGISSKAEAIYSKLTPTERFVSNISLGVLTNPITAGEYIYKTSKDAEKGQKVILREMSKRLSTNPEFKSSKAFIQGAVDASESIYATLPATVLGVSAYSKGMSFLSKAGSWYSGLGKAKTAFAAKSIYFGLGAGAAAISGKYVGEESGEIVKEISRGEYGKAGGRIARLGVVGLGAYYAVGGTGENFAKRVKAELTASEKGMAELKPPKTKFQKAWDKTMNQKKIESAVKERVSVAIEAYIKKYNIKQPFRVEIFGKKYIITPKKISPVFSSQGGTIGWTRPPQFEAELVSSLPKVSSIISSSQNAFVAAQKAFVKQSSVPFLSSYKIRTSNLVEEQNAYMRLQRLEETITSRQLSSGLSKTLSKQKSLSRTMERQRRSVISLLGVSTSSIQKTYSRFSQGYAVDTISGFDVVQRKKITPITLPVFRLPTFRRPKPINPREFKEKRPSPIPPTTFYFPSDDNDFVKRVRRRRKKKYQEFEWPILSPRKLLSFGGVKWSF